MVSETLTMGASLFPATSLFSIARRTDTVNFRHSVHFFYILTIVLNKDYKLCSYVQVSVFKKIFLETDFIFQTGISSRYHKGTEY